MLETPPTPEEFLETRADLAPLEIFRVPRKFALVFLQGNRSRKEV